MTGGFRWLFCMLVFAALCATSLVAQEDAPTPEPKAAEVIITEEGLKIIELGQRYMGQNNPNFALSESKLDMDARNEAGVQALRLFRQVTTLYPKYADGWLWLGIALTETLRYSKQHPQGRPTRTRASVEEGVRAFRNAYDCKPDDLVCATYYGDALMTLRGDFDAARKFWEQFLRTAKTDMQRVTALTQIARACLNKGYFGKIEHKLSAQEVKQQFLDAEKYLNEAAKMCPRAPNVKAMQELLDKYRKQLLGK